MNFRSKNLLITGGCGFIGSNFIKYILEKYVNVKIYNIDILSYASDLTNLTGIDLSRYNFIEGDINNTKLVRNTFKENKIDGVINFAAETHVDNSISNPDIFVTTNINGVFKLLKIAYEFWMNSPFEKKINFSKARFHQISTDEIYGSSKIEKFSEQSKIRPNSPYSASKASADLLVRSFNKTYGLDTTISVSSNNYGPNQHREKFIPKIIESLNKNQSIPIYGSGNNIRDWIYVIDNCRAIDLIYNNSKSGETYNIGGGNEFSNLELVKLIGKLVNIKPKIKFIKDRPGHDFRYSVCTSKIKNELNFSNQHDFKKTMKKYLKLYL